MKVDFQILQQNDLHIHQLIAAWYLSEWKIPAHTTIQKLQNITVDNSQAQILMTLEGIPISTGGLYHHVGLHDREPRFKIYQNWLALVYTIPDYRHKGYGGLLCKYIQEYAKGIGVDTLYLFTDTAERLYQRLGWTEMEKLSLGLRTITTMKLDL